MNGEVAYGEVDVFKEKTMEAGKLLNNKSGSQG